MSTPITYRPDFIYMPDVVFEQLWTELEWQRRGSTPRREYYCNTNEVPYTYGAGVGVRTYEPQPWHPAIEHIKGLVERAVSAPLEVCFLNGYEDARDHLGWHADDSPEMDDARPITIVTLGAEREIWFRPLAEPSAIEKVMLGSGSLLVMAPGMQDTHQHRIPKAGYACGPRISLTFRGYIGTSPVRVES